jgi:hypothetical protein
MLLMVEGEEADKVLEALLAREEDAGRSLSSGALFSAVQRPLDE